MDAILFTIMTSIAIIAVGIISLVNHKIQQEMVEEL